MSQVRTSSRKIIKRLESYEDRSESRLHSKVVLCATLPKKFPSEYNKRSKIAFFVCLTIDENGLTPVDRRSHFLGLADVTSYSMNPLAV